MSDILNRVLREISENQKTDATTMHSVYTSGLIDDESPVLSRVLDEIKNTTQSDQTTMHSVYTSGLIEDDTAE